MFFCSTDVPVFGPIFTTLGLRELKEIPVRIAKSAVTQTAANSENINILLFRFTRDYESVYAAVKGERARLALVNTKKE